MNSKTKNQNFQKPSYICYKKIKSIPKQNIISKKGLNNLEISKYNNSIEIDENIHAKFRKINRMNQQKPILSERIKRNYSNGSKRENIRSGFDGEQNSTHKIKSTGKISYKNLLGLYNISLSPSSSRKNRNYINIKNIFDKNIIINNNNFDKNIIHLGDEEYKNYKYTELKDKDKRIAQSSNEIFPYKSEKIYTNSKNSIESSQAKIPFFEHSRKKSKNNLSLNLSEPSCNNYNFKSLKNLNNSKNKNINIMKENENLKAELNKFLKENINLKIKMKTLQKNGKNIEINGINNSNNLFLKTKKKKNLSFKKNLNNNFNNEKNEEDNKDSNYAKTINLEGNQYKKDNEEKNNQTFNSIYDSMKFKIQKRKFNISKNLKSNNLNILNNINCNNSINLDNDDMNYNKLVLIKNEYSKTKETNFGIEKPIENLKKSSNNKNNSKCNIKYNGAEINNNNSCEIKVLKSPAINLQKDIENLNLTNDEYQQIPRNNVLTYSIPKCTISQHKESSNLIEKIKLLTNELEKMKAYQSKYQLLSEENSQLQQKFNALYNINETTRKKNEIYLKSIEEQQKKIKEKDNIINNLQNNINNIYKKNEDELKSKLRYITEQNKNLVSKLENIGEEMQKLREENDDLYKFKSNYSYNEIELIELQNKLNKYENINNKYESLKNNYEELLQKSNELKEYENKYKMINKEYNKIKNIENKYNELNNEYNNIMNDYDNLKEIKTKYEELLLQNNKLNDIKIKYDRINPEYMKLKEIREKYHEILKEQKNLIIIENKYYDLLEQVEELKEIKIKYEELLDNNGKNINTTAKKKEKSIYEKNSDELLSISKNTNFSIINSDVNNSDININSSQNINLSRNGSNQLFFSFKDGQTNIKPLIDNIKKENFINDNNKIDYEIKNNNDIFL